MNKEKTRPATFFCMAHRLPLDVHSENRYECDRGCSFPVVNGIPRFVADEHYAGSFGLQWNEYRLTQLDSHTKLPIYRDRLTRMAGGSLDLFKGKTVLEAGCGAGAFTEILLDAGAKVFATDLSSAVEANFKNFGGRPDYSVCQADLLHLPVAPESFDIVLCAGVVQHTPDPEETMTTLCSHVKPGGLLLLDHYTVGYGMNWSRNLLRWFLLKRSSAFSLKFCRAIMPLFWPVHRLIWKLRWMPLAKQVRKLWRGFSPIMDLQRRFQMSPELHYQWAVLVTHDMVTDQYKHLRTAEQIESHLRRCGMEAIETEYAGNGVEARARKPAPGGGKDSKPLYG